VEKSISSSAQSAYDKFMMNNLSVLAESVRAD